MTNLIWDKLLEDYLINNKSSNCCYDDERTAALFIGNKGSGKTSLINKFSKFTSNIQQESISSAILSDIESTPNSIIDYYYIRRPLKSIESNGSLTVVGHIFDIGSSTTRAPQLVELIAQRFINIVMVIVVDLSRPDMMYKEVIKGIDSSRKILINNNTNINRIIVVATKMDKLTGLVDPDHVRILLNALRCLCHRNKCSLITLSLRDGGNGIKIFTSFLRANLFPTSSNIPLIPTQMANTKDYNKPLAISFGTDNIDDIDEPYEGWEVYLSKIFPITIKLHNRVDDMSGGLERQIGDIVEKEKIKLNRELITCDTQQ